MRQYKSTSCIDCNEPIRATPSAKCCKPCRAKRTNESNKKRFKKNHASGLCWCGNSRTEGYKRCERCKEGADKTRSKYRVRKNEQGKSYRLEVKLAAFAAYGNRCACCPEEMIEGLEIDHIGGWGTQHRNKLGVRISGHALYRWLRDNKYPEGFRVLCGTCHSAISYWGYCPCKERLQAKLLAASAALSTIKIAVCPTSTTSAGAQATK